VKPNAWKTVVSPLENSGLDDQKADSLKLLSPYADRLQFGVTAEKMAIMKMLT
jgi:hypothetical protein